MAVIMEDRALLFRKNGKYRKLCQYSQQLFLREFPAVLPVQMDLRRGDIVPFQHSPDGVPLQQIRRHPVFQRYCAESIMLLR